MIGEWLNFNCNDVEQSKLLTSIVRTILPYRVKMTLDRQPNVIRLDGSQSIANSPRVRSNSGISMICIKKKEKNRSRYRYNDVIYWLHMDSINCIHPTAMAAVIERFRPAAYTHRFAPSVTDLFNVRRGNEWKDKTNDKNIIFSERWARVFCAHMTRDSSRLVRR